MKLIVFLLLMIYPISALGADYTVSTDLLKYLAREIVKELDSESDWRFVPNPNVGDLLEEEMQEPGREIPWDRNTVLVYLFTERGTGKYLPFSGAVEDQLRGALDNSHKFINVTRDIKFDKVEELERIYRNLNQINIHDNYASEVCTKYKIQYFMAGKYWKEQGETFIQAALWDQEVGAVKYALVKAHNWSWPLVRKKALEDYWKGLVGGLIMLMLLAGMNQINRTVLYNMHTRENGMNYKLVQLGFVILFTASGYGLAIWWLRTN